MKRSNGGGEARSYHDPAVTDYHHSSSTSRDCRPLEQQHYHSPPDHYKSTWRPSEFPRRRGGYPPASRGGYPSASRGDGGVGGGGGSGGGGGGAAGGGAPFYHYASRSDHHEQKSHEAYYKRTYEGSDKGSTQQPYYEYANRSRDYYHERDAAAAAATSSSSGKTRDSQSSHHVTAPGYSSSSSGPPAESPHYFVRQSFSSSERHHLSRPHSTSRPHRGGGPYPHPPPRHHRQQQQQQPPPPYPPHKPSVGSHANASAAGKVYFSDSSYSSSSDDDEDDEKVAMEPKVKKKKPRRGRSENEDKAIDDRSDGDCESESERFDQFPFGVPNGPLADGTPAVTPRGKRGVRGPFRGNSSNDGRGRGFGRFLERRSSRGRARGGGAYPGRLAGPGAYGEAEEEDKESDLGSEPESVDEDDEREVDDDNVGESWVWARMFALIKKRNWLKKAKEREVPLTEKQLDRLKVCDEDIEDISVRTEEQLDAVNKQIKVVKEEMFNSIHPPIIKQRKLDGLTQDAAAIQKRLDQWRDWMENGIEKKPPKKPVFSKEPQRGRNVFGKFDSSRYEKHDEKSNFVSTFKVKAPAVPPPTLPPPESQVEAAAAPAKVPCQNLIRYPTVAYSSSDAKPNLVSYPILGVVPTVAPRTTVDVKPSMRAAESGERDAISEMFDL